jgi:biotin carboxylase
MPTVVLVGGREAAMMAAARLGCRVFLLTERMPPRQRQRTLAGVLRIDFDTSREAFIRAAYELLGAELPDSVIAVTERGVLPAAWLREALELDGNSVETAHCCRDKFAMKQRARDHQIRCSDFAKLNARTTAAGLVQRLGLPIVLKPTGASGSRGTRIARHMCDLEELPGPGYVAESFVHGLEMSIESIVQKGQVIFTNPTEYLLPLWANVVPSTAIPLGDMQSIEQFNRRVIEAFGIRQGMTHLEFFLTAEGPVFGELAIRPPGGKLMDLLEHAYGFDPWEAVLQIESGLSVHLPQHANHSAGVWFFHPGGGRVRRVRGLKAAKSIDHVVEVACRAQVGTEVAARQGSGESVGHVIARAEARCDVVAALSLARKTLIIELESQRRMRRSNGA